MRPKARVDIFRPLTAAAAVTSSYRSTTASHASIFRRRSGCRRTHNHDHQQQQQQHQQQEQQHGVDTQTTMEFQQCISSETSDSCIISPSENCQWPHPHLNKSTTTLSSHSAYSSATSDHHEQQQQQQQQRRHRKLNKSNPLLATTTWGASNGHGSIGSSACDGEESEGELFCYSNDDTSESNPVSSAKMNNKMMPPPPSYYKIEIIPRNAINSGITGDCGKKTNQDAATPNTSVIILTSGDDASVQLTPNHNELLRLATVTTTSVDDDDEDGNHRLSNGIILASPIIEEDGIEQEASCYYFSTQERQLNYHNKQRYSPQQRWTVSENCEIIAIPPSPSSVPMTHCFAKKQTGGNQASTQVLLPPSPPPMLVKANSSSSSSSASNSSCISSSSFARQSNLSSSLSSTAECDKKNAMLPSLSYSPGSRGEKDLTITKSLATISLESPPRMTRSIISQSLFQESVSSCGEESVNSVKKTSSFVNQRQEELMSGDGNNGKDVLSSKGIIEHNGCGDSEKRNGSGSGGCGFRSEFLSWILDIFSLNGGCCHYHYCTRKNERNGICA